MPRPQQQQEPVPGNPYRVPTDSVDFGQMIPGRVGLRHFPRDMTFGPGVTTADLDSIVRQHYADGYAAAEREAEARAEGQREREAEAWDEGWHAASDTMVQQFASAVRRRIVADVHFDLMTAEQGPKSKAQERLAPVRKALDALQEWVGDVEQGHEPGV